MAIQSHHTQHSEPSATFNAAPLSRPVQVCDICMMGPSSGRHARSWSCGPQRSSSASTCESRNVSSENSFKATTSVKYSAPQLLGPPQWRNWIVSYSPRFTPSKSPAWSRLVCSAFFQTDVRPQYHHQAHSRHQPTRGICNFSHLTVSLLCFNCTERLRQHNDLRGGRYRFGPRESSATRPAGSASRQPTFCPD